MEQLHWQAKKLRQKNDLTGQEILFRLHSKEIYKRIMMEDLGKEEELYELLHFLLDFVKYLLLNKAVDKGNEKGSFHDLANLDFYIDFKAWIRKIAQLFSFEYDKDVRRRALELGFHLLHLAPFLGNEKSIMIDSFEKGFFDYVNLITFNQPESLEIWWEKRKRFPFCEFMLDYTEIRDLICIKFAIKIAVELSSHSCNFYELVSSLLPCGKRNWEYELVYLFGDHDSDLLKVLYRLLCVVDPAANFRLVLRFLDEIDFDHESIMDLILIEPDLAVNYLIGILLLISSHYILFQRICKEMKITVEHDTHCTSQNDDSEVDEKEETDYFESIKATFADLLTFLFSSSFDKEQYKKLEISFKKAFPNDLFD